MKLISVIMPVYNEPLKYIKESIGSILKQTYKNIELVIVVDNPAREDLIEMVKTIGSKDERIMILINEKNIGLTASLNRALGIVKGEFIARMDADDISFEDRLEVQLKYLTENNLDMVGCNIMDIDESGDPIDSGESKYPTTDLAIREYLKIGGGVIPHPTWLVRKEVFNNNQYVDFEACEDYGFLLNTALKGCKLGNIKGCKLKYRRNPDGITSTKKVQQRIGMYYLRMNYRHNRISTYENYLEYVNSGAGKRKMLTLEKYYADKKKAKSNIANKKYFTALFRLSLMLLYSNELENTIVDRIKRWHLTNKYREEF